MQAVWGLLSWYGSCQHHPATSLEHVNATRSSHGLHSFQCCALGPAAAVSALSLQRSLSCLPSGACPFYCYCQLLRHQTRRHSPAAVATLHPKPAEHNLLSPVILLLCCCLVLLRVPQHLLHWLLYGWNSSANTCVAAGLP